MCLKDAKCKDKKGKLQSEHTWVISRADVTLCHAPRHGTSPPQCASSGRVPPAQPQLQLPLSSSYSYGTTHPQPNTLARPCTIQKTSRTVCVIKSDTLKDIITLCRSRRRDVVASAAAGAAYSRLYVEWNPPDGRSSTPTS